MKSWNKGVCQYAFAELIFDDLKLASDLQRNFDRKHFLLFIDETFFLLRKEREKEKIGSVTKKCTVKTSKSERMPRKILMWEDQLGLRKNLPFVASKAKCKVILHEHNFRCIEQVRE